MHAEKGLKKTERDFMLLIFAKIKKKLSHILSEMLKSLKSMNFTRVSCFFSFQAPAKPLEILLD